MNLLNANTWEIAAGSALLLALIVVTIWLVLHKRPTPEELERARRLFLSQSGRLVDGMLLDVCEVEALDGRTLTMLMFNYRIGGVDYECSRGCGPGAGAGRLSLLGALPAGESAKQHCDRRRLDRAASWIARFSRIRRPRPH